MDSITHVVVGGAIGELAFGKKLGNKAVLLGALANTVPDFDVFFVRLAHDPDTAMRIHRSYTHALFTHPFMALPLAYLTYRIFKKEISFAKWFLFWWFGFFTHVMQDCCTTYGTQLFLPFTDKLIAWNNLAVVDPLYTIPCILFFITVFFIKKENPLRRRIGMLAIGVSMLYLGSATANKYRSASVFKKELSERHITYSHFSTTPTLFTSWLWNMVAYNDSTMWLAENSSFQKTEKMKIIAINRNIELIKPLADKRPVNTLIWFSQGNYFVEKGRSDTLDFYITKWGRPNFAGKDIEDMFRFYTLIYKDQNGKIAFKQREPDFSGNDVRMYFEMLNKRIFGYD